MKTVPHFDSLNHFILKIRNNFELRLNHAWPVVTERASSSNFKEQNHVNFIGVDMKIGWCLI